MSTKEVLHVIKVGDSYHLASESIVNWIYSTDNLNFVGASGTFDEPVPQHILEQLFSEDEEIDDEDKFCRITSGSWDNDRAIYFSALTEQYDSIKDIFDFFEDNDYTIGNTYSFYDY